jgi:hypothetical protein
MNWEEIPLFLIKMMGSVVDSNVPAGVPNANYVEACENPTEFFFYGRYLISHRLGCAFINNVR